MARIETKASPHFSPLPMHASYNRSISGLTPEDCSEAVREKKGFLLTGRQILCGIPFELGESRGGNDVLLVKDVPAFHAFPRPFHGRYIVFLHAADFKPNEPGADGIVPHHMGIPRLGETVAEYVLRYTDGTEHVVPIRRRFQINEFKTGWGNGGFECIPHTKPQSFRSSTDEFMRGQKATHGWGNSLFNSYPGGVDCEMVHWLWAVENPHPDRDLISIAFVPKAGTVFVFGMTGSSLKSNPIRWDATKRVKLTLPKGIELNEFGDCDDLDADLGCIALSFPSHDYGNHDWEKGYGNKPPVISRKTVVVEYTAHPQANLYFGKDCDLCLPLSELSDDEVSTGGYSIVRAQKPDVPVRIKIVDACGRPVSAKLHIHSADGEYLAPVNRHRFPNPYWFEDYSVDYANGGHYASYVDGEALVNLPEGEAFLEVTKGFEIKPVKCRYDVGKDTREITVALEHVLPWRGKGWVTADTHVHFLSPHSALLEGSAEGVNVVNLLASQWGELFTNIGDFDGSTTLGSREAGGSGEYLVRVGTENRQQILGHISLLGYEGGMILPLTTGGSDESRLGDPVECLLMDWAEQCRGQNGLCVLPHFPNPRAEGAAAIASGLIDGVEMTAWGAIFDGINPYSLSDWYRYLNCGFLVPAVGGTDKMSADTPVGGVRTYALIKEGPFTYECWKAAVRAGRTFATYGPLLDFHINGREMGETITFGREGGTLDIDWEVSSIVIPATKVELVVNGELREMKALDPGKPSHAGSWSVKAGESGWAALRVRAKHPDRSEVIAAHSSAIAVKAGDKPIFSRLDAMTILEQIEGAAAYVKNLGSKAEEAKYKRIMAKLTAAHRKLHNEMHRMGVYHDHTVAEDHH